MSITPDRAAALRERVQQDYPTSWIPEAADDVLVGEFVRFDEAMTSRGEQARIVVLVTEEGDERSLWLLGKVLREKFAEFNPQPVAGDLLAVCFKGKKQNAEGVAYANWQVTIDRQSVEDEQLSPVEYLDTLAPDEDDDLEPS